MKGALTVFECSFSGYCENFLRIELEFEHFELEHHHNCDYDYLEIREGGVAGGAVVGRWCGADTPPGYTSNTNSLYLTFRSDYSVSRSGFRLRYTTGDPTWPGHVSHGSHVQLAGASSRPLAA